MKNMRSVIQREGFGGRLRLCTVKTLLHDPTKRIMKRFTQHAAAALFAALLFAAGPAQAQQFVYQPENPAFGGAAVNYQWMLSSAQAQQRQNDRSGSFTRDPVADFQQSLQRQVLAQLSRELIQSRFGEDLDLSQEGHYDLGDFTIDVVPGLDGVDIRILNTATGAESTVTIPSF